MKPDKSPDHLAEKFPNTETELLGESALSVDDTVSLWHNLAPLKRKKNPSLYIRAGKEMLAAGEPLLAYDILSEGIDTMGGPAILEQLESKSRSLLVVLLQQQSLALAQSGASGEANAILCTLKDSGFSDSETLGILGRTWKDMAQQTNVPEERKLFLHESFNCYNESFQADCTAGKPDTAYYTGINAAAVSLLGGDFEQSKNIAGQVQNICRKILKEKNEANEQVSFWLYASLGEASLLHGDFSEAENWYAQAVQGCSMDIRALGSMRKQARLILEAAGENNRSLDHFFPVPSVVLFSGHLIDHPTRETRRFPPGNEEQVRIQIAEWLEKKNGQIGYSSAACGADIIFLEEMLRRKGEINIILPFEREQFIRTSVNIHPGANWTKRFEKVMSKAKEIKILSQYSDLTIDDDLLFANLYLYGTAQTRAERAGTDLQPLLVWDRSKAKSLAGTAAIADLIQNKGGIYKVISPNTETELVPGDTEHAITISEGTENSTSVTVGERTARHHSFLPLLIADVKGYSRLNKREKLIFASSFMGEMADVLRKFDDRILGRKTLGDGLFLVFKDLQACVLSARALREHTANQDWTKFGLSSQLTMRISLDAGPCYSFTDPITAQRDFCGDYIVRAARLEPVTPPGNIYASETFVAMSRALGIKDIQFDYAGQMELPKGYGRMQAFHVK